MESDPIGLGGGINTFGYVGSSPLDQIDPDGLQIIIPPAQVGGAAGAAGAAGGAWWNGSQGTGGLSGYGSSPAPGWGSWGSWRGSDDDASKNSCPAPDKDPCKGHRKALKEHEDKLRDFKNNPPEHDNLGVLGQGYDHFIIPGRIRTLERAIRRIKKELEKCEAEHGKGN